MRTRSGPPVELFVVNCRFEFQSHVPSGSVAYPKGVSSNQMTGITCHLDGMAVSDVMLMVSRSTTVCKHICCERGIEPRV